jgi:hypothetical protein
MDWFLVGGGLLILLLVVVILSRGSGDADIEVTITGGATTGGHSGCCQMPHQDHNGNDINICAYQPLRDNAGPNVAPRLSQAPSFARACVNVGGTVSLEDNGSSCRCRCDGARRDITGFVAPDGTMNAVVPFNQPFLDTLCPGYR